MRTTITSPWKVSERYCHGCVCHDDADPLHSDSKYRARASETSVSSSALSKWPV
jgi:hypothetical protein